MHRGANLAAPIGCMRNFTFPPVGSTNTRARRTALRRRPTQHLLASIVGLAPLVVFMAAPACRVGAATDGHAQCTLKPTPATSSTLLIDNDLDVDIQIPDDCWEPGLDGVYLDGISISPGLGNCDDVAAGNCPEDCFGHGSVTVAAHATYTSTWTGKLANGPIEIVPSSCEDPPSEEGDCSTVTKCQATKVPLPGTHVFSITYSVDGGASQIFQGVPQMIELPAATITLVVK